MQPSILLQSAVLLRCQIQVEPAPANRDSMLNRRTAFQVEVCVSSFGQFNNFLFARKSQMFGK